VMATPSTVSVRPIPTTSTNSRGCAGCGRGAGCSAVPRAAAWKMRDDRDSKNGSLISEEYAACHRFSPNARYEMPGRGMRARQSAEPTCTSEAHSTIPQRGRNAHQVSANSAGEEEEA
jgi:hypothetical protein